MLVEGIGGVGWWELVPSIAVVRRIVVSGRDVGVDDAKCSPVGVLCFSGVGVREDVEKTGSGVTKEV